MAASLESESESASSHLQAKSLRLVVLVPGFGGQSSLWEPLRRMLEKERGYGPHEARWLAFDHHIKIWTTGRIDNLAVELQARIDAEWAGATSYGDVVLVGHSTGGLIARQVYLRAAGAVQGEERSDWESG